LHHVDVEGAPAHLQMELIELQEDLDLTLKFQDVQIQDFYRKHFKRDKYPSLMAYALKTILLFSTYA